MTNDGEQLTEKSFRMSLILRNGDILTVLDFNNFEKHFEAPISDISKTSENPIVGLFNPQILRKRPRVAKIALDLIFSGP